MFRRRYHNKRTRLIHETVENRFCLSTVAFVPNEIPVLDNPRAVDSADFDGDGDIDVVSASYGDGRIAWHKNTGSGSFESDLLITKNADGAGSIVAADLDGDGDVDILSASGADDKIAWYENSGVGVFSEQQIITTQADSARAVFATDLDGDGDVDVLSASAGDNKIAWYENMGAGIFGAQKVITTQVDAALSVFAADLDGDGDADVLSGSRGDDKIAWYENAGDGVFGSQQLISSNQGGGSEVVYAADLDGDDDLDVLSARAWYENLGGGEFGFRTLIATDGASTIFASDLDGDSDLDVLRAGGNGVTWHENRGEGVFGEEQLIASRTPQSRGLAGVSADLDNDGDLDVLSAISPRLVWHENNGDGTFDSGVLITAQTNAIRSVFAADVDGDGDTDILAHGDPHAFWYENVDGAGTLRPRLITRARQENDGAGMSIFAADMDGDDDLDVLAASNSPNWGRFGAKIVWYENTDGLGTFGPQQVISGNVYQPLAVFAADLDGDGDLDVISGSDHDDKVAWYENTGGPRLIRRQQHIITTQADRVQAVDAVDVDGDGDIDVLSASKNDSKIAWYENVDGSGLFGPQQVITTRARGSDRIYSVDVYAVDIDGDGDVDVVSGAAGDGKISWYKNIDGAGTFGPQQVIATIRAESQRVAVFVTDVNGDGHVDVLSSSAKEREIVWHPNTDGTGVFGPPQLVTQDGHFSAAAEVFAVDIDGDHDVDVFSTGLNVWYENRVPFDSNDDGQFNSSDLVHVFRAGEYEDDISTNSTFDEGDWNGDGDFTSSDLVFAFQSGAYVAEARPTAKIAAALDRLLARENLQELKKGNDSKLIFSQ